MKSSTSTRRTTPALEPLTLEAIARYSPSGRATLSAARAWQRAQLRTMLSRMNPKEFEALAGEVLVQLGYVRVKVQPPGADGGVDIHCQRYRRSSGTFRKCIVQVKRQQANVGRRLMDEFRGGAMRRNRGALGIFVTLSDFTSEALEAAYGSPRIKLIDGEQLIDYIMKHDMPIGASTLHLIEPEKILRTAVRDSTGATRNQKRART